MRKFMLFSIFFFLVGCSHTTEEELVWYPTKKEAIEHGLKEEGIKEKNIVDEIQVNNEAFIIFSNTVTDNYITLGVANLVTKDNKYTWFRSSAYTRIYTPMNKNGIEVRWEIKSKARKKFSVYAGTLENDNMTISTDEGEISPVTNKELGIYYYLTVLK